MSHDLPHTSHTLEPLRRAAVRVRSLGAHLGRRRVPLHRGEGFAPFYIVGSGRSGTTLTRRILRGVPGVHIPSETIDLGAVLRAARRNRAATWVDLVWMVLGAFEAHSESDTFELCPRAVAEKLLRIPPRSRSLARIIDAIYRHGAPDATRWGDKTVLNTLAMPEIVAVFPDARFVHLLRDGVDVAYSCRAAGRYATLAEGAMRWRNAVRCARAFARSHPDTVLEVRYEEIVTEPDASARRICCFLDLPYKAEVLEVPEDVLDAPDMSKHWRYHANITRPIDASSIGRGRRAIDDGERHDLDRLIGAELAALGYDRAA